MVSVEILYGITENQLVEPSSSIVQSLDQFLLSQTIMLGLVPW